MTRARLDGLYLLLLGCAAFLLLGFAFEHTSSVPMIDFKAVYYPARCLMQHCDPYSESEVLRIYRAGAVAPPLDADRVRQAATRYLYLPSAFCFTVPFAMLPWGPAHILWMAVIVGSIILASFLVWDLGADYSPVSSGFLAGIFLANSEVLIVLGNTAAIAVSLCVIAVWCFLRERFIWAGIFCLAFSVAIKPQDAGLVWLYLLLAGGIYRKRALQTLSATVALGLPMVLWVWRVAPHWMQEWRSNVSAFSAHGGMNDPGPASTGGHGLGMLVNLQAVVSVFRDDPRIYNPVTYIVCAVLLLILGIATLRTRPSPRKMRLALGAIAALSMLPVYHHLYDAKLLLLTIPACAMLWAEGGATAWLAVLVNGAALVLTGDLPWAVLLGFIGHMRPPTTALGTQILIAVQVFPAPLILLVTGVFYLWVYVRACRDHASRLPLESMARMREASAEGL